MSELESKGFLVLDNGDCFEGLWNNGGEDRAGEVVFNTSHSGYEEIATDPSYFSQIVVMTAPMQGNYGIEREVWESKQIWIEGFVCLKLQNTSRDDTWQQQLRKNKIPILSEVETRSVVLNLRSKGTPWGALVQAATIEDAKKKAAVLIEKKKAIDPDWVYLTSRTGFELRAGQNPKGPRIAVIDYGCKENIVRELEKRCSEVGIFPSRATSEEVLKWNPQGVMLSNGPGDPAAVEVAPETVRKILGKKPVMGICMGHQILGLALGGKTFKLKFGHRGSNHPIQDVLLSRIYMTSQNHGYAVSQESLPKDVRVTHTNLNDGTVAGMHSEEKNCLGIQFHPESHPGPHEATGLFDFFIEKMIR